MSKTKNNHYISKYLTKPWEIQLGKVRIFDYGKKEFREEDTEYLFTKQELFTQEEENFFNKYIETISRQELSTIEEKDFRTTKWKNYRALVLLLWDLVGRMTAAKDGDTRSVKFFTNLDEDGLNQMVKAIEEQFKLAVLTVPDDGRLFFPSNLILFAFDATTGHCGFGIPFEQRKILFSIPKGANFEYLTQLCKNHFFINTSMGNSITEFVIVSPDLEPTEELAKILVDQREKNNKLVNDIGAFRKLDEEFRHDLVRK